MKNLGITAIALLLASGISFAAMGGDKCCSSESSSTASVKTPLTEKADALFVKWEEMGKKMPAAMAAIDPAEMAKAMATFKDVCPVCKNMPTAAAHLSKVMSLSNDLEKACEEKCSKEAAAIPAEMKAKMQERAALLSKSQKMLTVIFSSVEQGDAKGAGCCKEGEKKACCEGGEKNCALKAECYTELNKESEKLSANWSAVPGKFASLSAEDKTRMQSAMATMKKAGAPCELFHQSILSAKEMIDRSIALDSELEKACHADPKNAACAKSEETKAICKTFGARTETLKKTSQLLDNMAKTMNPEASNSMFAAQ